MSVKILQYQPEHAAIFRDLNLSWLKKYFYVEVKDKHLLDDSKKHILDKGGFIFMAESKGKIIGCYSLIPYESNIYELGKMAVHEEHQGLKIGQKLIQHAIDFALENTWEALVLYSSTKLPTALHIYRKFGFEDILLEKDLPYARSDVKMLLKF